MPKTTEHTSKKSKKTTNTDAVMDVAEDGGQNMNTGQPQEPSTDVLENIDIDNMSADDINRLFDNLDTERKTKTESTIPAAVIRTKFIEPLFAAGRQSIPVSTLQHTIDRAYKLTGDDRMQYSSVRSAAGAHRVGTVDGVALIFPYPVHKDGTKMTAAEVAAVEARSKINKVSTATTSEQIDKLADDIANGQ